jgi:glycosyltransferase involved in cell wall biosynthesis
MLKTIFLTSSTGVEGKNYEHIMRVIFLSRFTKLTLLTSSQADFRRYLSAGTQVVKAPFLGKLGLMAYAPYWVWKNRRELKNACLFTEPSVIGLVGFLAKKIADLKWIVDVWDIPIRYTGGKKFRRLRITVTRHLLRWAYKKADLFIVGIRPDMEFQFYRVPQEKILLWQTTIWIPENKQYRPKRGDDKTFNIICMKSMHDPACGLDVLLRAFQKIKGVIPGARLWIIGKVRADAAEIIKDVNDIEGVEFFGFLEHDKVMRLIQESHLAVIPWHNEIDLAQPYPTKVMEYMTEGKVVLAARVAGIADMIKDGEDGLLFAPGDADHLAENIVKLYKDRSLRERLAAKARLYHPRFDTVRKHEEIFRALKKLVHDTSDYDFEADKDFIRKYTS